MVPNILKILNINPNLSPRIASSIFNGKLVNSLETYTLNVQTEIQDKAKMLCPGSNEFYFNTPSKILILYAKCKIIGNTKSLE